MSGYLDFARLPDAASARFLRQAGEGGMDARRVSSTNTDRAMGVMEKTELSCALQPDQ